MFGIFGMGKGLHFKHLLSPLKSVIMHTIWFFLGMLKVGAAHSTDVTLVSKPIDSNLTISSLVTC